jgi:hypothetical protein
MVQSTSELRINSSIRRMSSYTVLPKTFTTNGWTTRLKKNPASAYGFGSLALELTTTSRRIWWRSMAVRMFRAPTE